MSSREARQSDVQFAERCLKAHCSVNCKINFGLIGTRSHKSICRAAHRGSTVPSSSLVIQAAHWQSKRWIKPTARACHSVATDAALQLNLSTSSPNSPLYPTTCSARPCRIVAGWLNGFSLSPKIYSKLISARSASSSGSGRTISPIDSVSS